MKKTVYLVSVGGRAVGEIVEVPHDLKKPDPLKEYVRTPYKVRSCDARRIRAFTSMDEAKRWLCGETDAEITLAAFRPVPKGPLSLLRCADESGDINPSGMRLSPKECKWKDALRRLGLIDGDRRLTQAGWAAMRSGLAPAAPAPTMFAAREGVMG